MAAAKTILVIDDDPDIGEFCQTVLQPNGWAVRVACSAAEGMAELRRERPGLLILDVMMEEADSGFELAKKLGREYPGLPVLMLSSLAAAAQEVFDTSALPVSELVEKPIRADELVKTVERLWAKAKTE